MIKYIEYEIPLVMGDIIAVSYNNYIYKGLFVKYGTSGNVHFILLNRIDWIYNNKQTSKRLSLDYLNTNANRRIVKMSEEHLTLEERDLVEQGREYILKTYF